MELKVKNARLSFANIRKPYTPKTGDAKYRCNLICDENTKVEIKKEDGTKITVPHHRMQEIIDKILKDKWGKLPGKLENYLYNRADTQVGPRGPMLNTDGEYYEGYDKDTMFFAAGAKVADRPEGILIIDQKREPLPASSGHPVSGDYVNAIINAFAYEYEGKKGVSASLDAIQFLRKGKPFGATRATADSFDEEELEDEEEEEADDGGGIF